MTQFYDDPATWEMSRDAVPEGHVQITVYDVASGRRVATVFDDEANAYLIAAAPDLLKAAIANVDRNGCARDCLFHSAPGNVHAAWCIALRDAIEKGTP